MKFLDQLGDSLGEEVLVSAGGGGGRRGGAEVEMSQRLAVRERPEE